MSERNVTVIPATLNPVRLMNPVVKKRRVAG